MRTLWAVLWREIWERRQVVWLGLFLGVLCPVFARMPGGFRATPDLYEGMAIGVSASFFMTLIVGLGLFASDQASGRVAFYLSRPVRPWQLLVGRVVAAVVVLLVGTTLVSLPTLWLADKLWLASRRPDADSLVLALWLVGLLLAATHVLAVALRLRGRWTLFDLGAFAATGLLAGSVVQNWNRLGIGIGAQLLAFLLAGVVILTAALGVWVQLRHGGTQRGRLHAAFSLIFWPLLLAATAYQDVQLRLEVSRDWDDVTSFVDARPASDGSAAWLAPRLPRAVSYLLDFETGRRFTMEQAAWFPGETNGYWWEPTLRGRTARWAGCDSERPLQAGSEWDREHCGFRLLDLDAEEARPVAVPSVRVEQLLGLALSRDGRRLAHLTEDRLLIFDVDDLRPIHQLDLPDARHLFGFHEDGSLLVLVRSDPGTWLTTVSQDGSVRTRSIDQHVWKLNSTPEFLVETGEDERWLVEADGRKVQNLPKELFSDALARRLVDDWVVWISESEKHLEAVAADGRRRGPMSLPEPNWADGALGRLVAVFGPDLADSGQRLDRVLVSVGRSQYPRAEPPWWTRFGLARLASGHLGNLFRRPTFAEEQRLKSDQTVERWTTHYVDLDAENVVATFEGFRVRPERIETESGLEAWLLDERGLPHRFDPDRLDPDDPIASLEPVFDPPWSDGE